MARTCAATGCANEARDGTRYCGAICRVRANASRLTHCAACKTPLNVGGRGRPASYCSRDCRMAGAKLRVYQSPGAVREFIEYQAVAVGGSATTERLFTAYVGWCDAQRIEPMPPGEMLPLLEGLGFEVRGDGADQRIARVREAS